jgi:hypothetical protein
MKSKHMYRKDCYMLIDEQDKPKFDWFYSAVLVLVMVFIMIVN